VADRSFLGQTNSALPGAISGQPELRKEKRWRNEVLGRVAGLCKEVAILSSLYRRTTNEGFNTFNHQAEKKAPVFPVSEPTRMIANLNRC
jgi:hypothetical protein